MKGPQYNALNILKNIILGIKQKKHSCFDFYFTNTYIKKGLCMKMEITLLCDVLNFKLFSCNKI